jgi:RNA polymerase primary sigma factor
MIETIKMLMRAQRALSEELGREPTIEELAQQVALSTERIREVVRTFQDAVPAKDAAEFMSGVLGETQTPL